MCIIYIIGIVNAKEAESLNPNHDVDVPTEYISEGEDSLSNSDGESTSDHEVEYWDCDIETGDFDYDDEDKEDYTSLNRLLFATVIFIFLWASLYGISAVAVNHLLQYLHHILSSLAVHSPPVAAVVTASRL